MNKVSGLLVLASLSPIVTAVGCANGGVPGGEPAEVTTKVAALTGTLSADFEDGAADGWIPRGSGVALTNVTDQANTGTHSLLTTGRTAGFMGPSIDLTSQLQQGANYRITVFARLAAGTPATTVNLTMQRSPTGGSTAFDSVAFGVPITDSAWVQLSGTYSFNAPVTDLSAVRRVGQHDGLLLHRYVHPRAVGAAAAGGRLRGRDG